MNKCCYHVLLSIGLLISASSATLLYQWTGHLKACGVYDCEHDGPRSFQHPFLQIFLFFLGKFICFILYFFSRLLIGRLCPQSSANLVTPAGRKSARFTWRRSFVFILPLTFELFALTTVYVALNLTYTASFSLLSGLMALFTGVLSLAFLGRSVSRDSWVAFVLIVIGLGLVGGAEIIFDENLSHILSDINGIIAGGLLLILALIVAGAQFVCEEKYIKIYNVPAPLAVGVQGVFGVVVVGLLLIPMYFTPAARPFSMDRDERLENVIDGFVMISEDWRILVAVLGTTVSYVTFSLCGALFAKDTNATSRSVLLSPSVVMVIFASLAIGWRSFFLHSFLVQLAGSLILLVGVCVYNDILFCPFLRKHHLISAPLSTDNVAMTAAREYYRTPAPATTPAATTTQPTTSSRDGDYASSSCTAIAFHHADTTAATAVCDAATISASASASSNGWELSADSHNVNENSNDRTPLLA